MTRHTISWTLDNIVGPAGRIICHGNEDSDCHLYCSRSECEEGCECDEPLLVRIGYCNPLTWIEESDGYLWESFDSAETVALRDGEIIFQWTGDGFTWGYRKEPT